MLQPGKDMFQAKLCIADDDDDIRYLLRFLLNKAGFEAIEDFSDGIGLLNSLQASSDALPDVIITDIDMPNINGMEVLNYIKSSARKDVRNIPLIVITGVETDPIRDFMRDISQLIILPKPFKSEDLRAVVSLALTGRY